MIPDMLAESATNVTRRELTSVAKKQNKKKATVNGVTPKRHKECSAKPIERGSLNYTPDNHII